MSGHFEYHHPEGLGFGEYHAVLAGRELDEENRHIDLKDGQLVDLVDINEETAWPIIHWIDAIGLDRLTTVSPQTFNEHFRMAV